MKTRHLPLLVILAALLSAGAVALLAQGTDIFDRITKGDAPSIAVIDFRGTGLTQQYMNAFNNTVWDDLDDSGVFEMRAKTFYPLEVPQQPTDFRPPTITPAPKAGEDPIITPHGPWLTDWNGPPVNATYLAFGFVAEQAGSLVLYGNLFDVQQPNPQAAQVFGNRRYVGSLDQAGAVKVAHQYAADILDHMGVTSLSGTRIYFVSDRTGNREIWSMDYDGQNQKQITNYKSSAWDPAVSPDGKLIAFRLLVNGKQGNHWEIRLHSTETGRRLAFSTPQASSISSPSFSPDGQRLFFSVSVEYDGPQIVSTNLSGGDLRRISHINAIEVEPDLNPKTGTDMLFISGRTGKPQLWRMNIDGTNPQMLTTGEGDVANPSWSPDGYHATFSWTRGYDIGGFNVFVMDVADRGYVQLTHGNGSNESPSWAPDGLHLTFSNEQRRVKQIFTMLANGTKVKKLTSQGNNNQPVWGKAIN